MMIMMMIMVIMMMTIMMIMIMIIQSNVMIRGRNERVSGVDTNELPCEILSRRNERSAF